MVSKSVSNRFDPISGPSTTGYLTNEFPINYQRAVDNLLDRFNNESVVTEALSLAKVKPGSQVD